MLLQIIILKFCFKTFLRVGRFITSCVYLNVLCDEYLTSKMMPIKAKIF